MVAHKKHYKKDSKNLVKWSIISGSIILVAVLAMFMWSDKSLESSSDQNQDIIEEIDKYLASDCSVLDTEDVIFVFNNQEVTLEKETLQETVCSKSWRIWEIEGTSKTVLDSISLIVTDTTKLASYDYQNPSSTLERICSKYPSINLGDYKSCNLFGEIYFGKLNYFIQLQCVGCPEGHVENLAKRVDQRI